MNTKSILVRGITHRYNGQTALDGISYEVLPGEIFGFLGPNGAGKTTMIRILTGQLRPTTGKAWVAGCDVVEEREQLKPRIGVVFEYQNLYTRLSGRDNLNFSTRLYGIPKSKVDEVLAQVEMEERADEPVKKYSNGMKQRLMIARALLHQPEVLFLDEPTRGLDPGIARSIRLLIAGVAQSGMTIFLTTHYIEEAERLCDRVAFIGKGSIIKIDTVSGLLEDTKEANIVEVLFEADQLNKNTIVEHLKEEFPDVECSLKNDDTIKVLSQKKIDIAPIVGSLAASGISILEAKLIKPTLEDAFVKMTGIEIEIMNGRIFFLKLSPISFHPVINMVCQHGWSDPGGRPKPSKILVFYQICG